ncbi:MAG: beta-ketoacyl synthase N-terminal-like domain-containing protein, partial [Gemmataceae bacterium]
VASLLAVGEAVNVVRRGTADVMLAGGSDNRAVWLAMIRYPLFAEMSARNDDPEHAVRPFDTHREGQVMGDGSGTLVVEELDHARRRGGPILAEVLGFAAGFDRGRTGAGLARVMRQALKRAGLTPADLDHINSGAPGTRADDAWEARAIAELLGDADVPVLAAKSYFGNLGTASSVIEIMASLAPMMKGWRPGTLNHHETAPDCPVRVLREPGPVQRPVFMKIAGTDLGQCAVLVLRRWEEQP